MHKWLKAFPAGICASALAAALTPTVASASLPAPAGSASIARAASTASVETSGLAALHAQISANPSLAKLDNSLLRFKQAYDGATAAGTQSALNIAALSPKARVRYQSPLAAPSVLVDVIASGDVKVTRAQLEKLGFQTSAVFRNDIGGWLPLDRAGDAVALSNLRFVKTAMMHTHAAPPPNPVAYEGDYVQRSFFVRQANPALNGTGVTVGVISDSFDCNGFNDQANPSATHLDDYADDVALGALPANVTVLKEDVANGACPGTDEGRALAQIVYAVAPGATIKFYTAEGSEADFAQGILTLALPTKQTDPNGVQGGGAQIIDDDVGYFDEPVYQEGIVGLAIDEVASGSETFTPAGSTTPVTATFSPVLYFSSAGNEGSNSYENLAPQFSGAPATGAPNAGEQILNIDTSNASQSYFLPITIPKLRSGDAYTISLFWGQPYQSGTGSGDPGDVNGDPGIANGPGAASVLDFCIGDANGNLSSNGTVGPVTIFSGPLPTPTSCAGPSNLAPNSPTNDTGSVPGDKDPYNIIEIANLTSGVSDSVSASIVIGLVSGPIPSRVKVIIQDDGRGTTINKFATNSSTIQGHPLSPNAMAVGATWWDQAPLCDTAVSTAVLESYSSIGGAPFLFNASGGALPTPVYPAKPDIVAPDGISTTFFGFSQPPTASTTPSTAQCQLGSTYNGFEFFGTSAAAPHAAATAALMLQAYPAATPGQVYSSMRFSALSMNTPAQPAFNYNSGYGFLQADAAMTALNNAVNPPAVGPGNPSGVGGSTDPNSGAFSPMLLLPGLLLAGLRRRKRR